MKAAVALLGLAIGLAAASTVVDYVPDCADQCILDGIAAGTCSLEDAVCQCEYENFEAVYEAAVECVLDSCGEDVALNEVLPGAEEFCAEYGGTTTTSEPTSTPADGPSASTSSMTPTNAATDTDITPTAAASTDGETASVTSSTPAVTAGAAAVAPVGALAALAIGGLAFF